MKIVSALVAFLSSIIGSICGIGGGVIIKPVMDAVSGYSAATISFLSGVTVLCMSTYSVVRGMIAKDSHVELKTATKLGIGAAIGGIIGKVVFELIKQSAGDGNVLTAVQSVCLFIVTLGTFLYTLFKSKIKPHKIDNTAVMVAIGLALGIMSSFLGIGGGPINLVVLFFFCSMETKQAAQNSLYIILISQFAGTLYTILAGKIPANLPVLLMIIMAVSGILGGVVGRMINKKINGNVVSKLFLILQAVLTCICVYNFVRAVIA